MARTPKTLAFVVLAALVAAAWVGASAFLAPRSMPRVAAPAAGALAAAMASPVFAAQAPASEETPEENYILIFFILGTVALFNAVFQAGGVKSLNQAIWGKDR